MTKQFLRQGHSEVAEQVVILVGVEEYTAVIQQAVRAPSL